ncbi:ATP cone domain-containing protein [Vibrio breoganii]
MNNNNVLSGVIVITRDGSKEAFKSAIVARSIRSAFDATREIPSSDIAMVSERLAAQLTTSVTHRLSGLELEISEVQALIESALLLAYPKTGKAYVKYRSIRDNERFKQRLVAY